MATIVAQGEISEGSVIASDLFTMPSETLFNPWLEQSQAEKVSLSFFPNFVSLLLTRYTRPLSPPSFPRPTCQISQNTLESNYGWYRKWDALHFHPHK